MPPSIADTLEDELPTHPDWRVDESTSDRCVWRRPAPPDAPNTLVSVVLLRRDDWSVSFAYQAAGPDDESLSVGLERFTNLADALNEIETTFADVAS